MSITISDTLIKRMLTLSRVTTNNLEAKILVPFAQDGFLISSIHKYISKELKVDVIADGQYDLILSYHPHENTQQEVQDLYQKLSTNGRLLVLATEVLSKKFKEWLSKVDGSMEDIPEFELGKVKGKLLIIDKLEVVEKPKPQRDPNMKMITIQKEPLTSVLKKVKEVISKHPTLDVLSNILIKVKRGAIELVATDLQVTIVAEIPCVHDELVSYSFLLPFDFFNKIVGLINSAEIVIETSKDSARVSGSNDVYEIEKLDKADDFPKVPEFPADHVVDINSDFITWLNKSLDTVGDDTNRPAMSKVFLGIGGQSLAVASTNARILFEKVFKVDSPAEAKLLISPKVVKAMKGFSETEISWNATHVAFKTETLSLIGTLQDETYPNYRGVLPTGDLNVTLSRNELIAAMEKANVTSGSTNSAMFHMKKEIGTLIIDSLDLEHNRKTEVRLAMNYDGPCDKISFNPDSMLKVLKQVDYEKISMSIHASNKGVLLKSDADPDYTGFIMPVY